MDPRCRRDFTSFSKLKPNVSQALTFCMREHVKSKSDGTIQRSYRPTSYLIGPGNFGRKPRVVIMGIVRYDTARFLPKKMIRLFDLLCFWSVSTIFEAKWRVACRRVM